LAGASHSCLTQGTESTTKRSVFPNKLLLILALLTISAAAFAQAKNDEWDGGFDGPKAERRSNFALGLRLAPALGWARGYPNEASKIDNSQYLASTHGAGGFDYELYLGGAIRDWFTFAIGMEGIGIKGNSITASAGVYTLRTEIYPGWTLGGAWRDLGVAMDFGIGAMKLQRNGADVANGGAIGFAGFEVFHETLRLGKFNFGPALGYRKLFSPSVDGDILYLGLHSAFYTGP
jgi:hypothetical protein